MENPKNTSKQENQKMGIGMGGGSCRVGCGGGVGGVVVWGGVVAIATFVSVSAIKLRKKKRLPDKSHHPLPIPSADVSNKMELNTNKDDQGKGLRVLLQDSSPPIDYHPSRDGKTDTTSIQIDSTSLDLTKSLILDENSVLDINGENVKPTYLDILLGDNSKPESPLAIDHAVKVQESSLPMSDGTSLLAESKAIEAFHADLFVEEEHPQMQLIIGKEREVEMEEQDNGENIVEIVEEVSERARTNQFVAEGDIEVTESEAEDSRNMKSIEETIETTQKDQFAVEVDLEDKNEAIAARDAPQIELIEAEDNPQMQLIEEEQGFDDGENAKEQDYEEVEKIEDDPQEILSEEEDSDEDDVDEDEAEIVEKGEDSSEGTGDSSMESNAEAIWPAESIEELSLESKELNINNQKTEEENHVTEEHGFYENECVKNVKIYENGRHGNEDTGKSIMNSSKKAIQELLTRINASMESSNLGIWIWSTSVVVLLLVVVVAPLLLSPAHMAKLCLIIFTVVILSRV